MSRRASSSMSRSAGTGRLRTQSPPPTDCYPCRPQRRSVATSWPAGARLWSLLLEQAADNRPCQPLRDPCPHRSPHWLCNRRRVYAEREIERTRRYGRPMSLMLVDLTASCINDCYGHPVGDQALRGWAAGYGPMRSRRRHAEGDEFAIICPETDSRGAETLGRRSGLGPDQCHRPDTPLPQHRHRGGKGDSLMSPNCIGGLTCPLRSQRRRWETCVYPRNRNRRGPDWPGDTIIYHLGPFRVRLRLFWCCEGFWQGLSALCPHTVSFLA